jgi:hypothetical protein
LLAFPMMSTKAMHADKNEIQVIVYSREYNLQSTGSDGSLLANAAAA